MASQDPASPSPPSDDFEEDAGLLEKQTTTEPVRSAKRRRSRCGAAAAAWWLSNVLMGAALMFLLFQRSGHIEVAGDVNRIWPALSQELVTFQPDNRYAGNLTAPSFKQQTHELWLSLVPKGLGFIEVADPSQHASLPPPYIKYGKPVYTTSATHQLHCLYMIMTGFNELSLNGGRFVHNMDTGGEHDEGLTREGEDPAEHLAHCFDSLRQAIMCHGDTALEGLQTTFGPGVGGSDGWNVQHVCKPWNDIYDWLETNRIDDRVWI